LISKTVQEYNQVIKSCKEVFEKKTQDYGTTPWRILRMPSLTDQILIKVQRIRSIQEKGIQKVEEDITNEFVGIINYCLIAMMQMELAENVELELKYEVISPLYDQFATETLQLLQDKNHDYGEVWREMRISSITDIILAKVYRTKQIEDNAGKTLISEGVKANYQDMLNYAVFCLIKLNFVS
jgi:hypothetical protein